MKYAASIHFLEKAIGTLDATLAQPLKNPANREQLEAARADVLEGIEALKTVGYVEERANEIRSRV